ncbi:MAG: hypothetical protein JWP61_143 [Friedmanniella sp.]|nr:hypothetical protein [Friedmanniella sp.]
MTIRRVRRPYAVPLVALGVALLALTGCGPTTGPQNPSGTPSLVAASPSPSSTSPSVSDGPTPTPSPTVRPTIPTKPETPPARGSGSAPLMAPGASGEQVRELQHRLRQLAWFSGPLSGSYGAGTTAAVKGFQAKRGLDPTGQVDTTTWRRLTALTTTPTRDERHDVLTPGPALLRVGSTGDRVRDLQARLRQIGWYAGNVTGSYGSVTSAAVRGFQAKRAIPVTGAVDQRTLDRLTAMTRVPTTAEKNNRTPRPSAAGLDSRCLTGRVLCISKTSNSLTWVIDGRPQLRVDVRFGSYETPTREGSFAVGWKSRHHVSTIYHTPMPYAMFFSGGQAVHYSADFAARGYAGASHGCVNVRNLAGIQTLFAQVRVGDRVVVHR